MEITPKPEQPSLTFPLPLFESAILADASVPNLGSFSITVGTDKAAVEQFKNRSCDQSDTDLMRFTSDYTRICTESYETWYQKGRVPFALLNSRGVLAGIVWFGKKDFPELAQGHAPASAAWNTFAIRTYPPFRGQGLAFPFADFCITMFRELTSDHDPIWLETNEENVAGTKLYKKLGFIECGPTKAGRLVMWLT